VPTTAKGYEGLLCWVQDFGPLRCAGIEGTSSYGAGLARHLRARGIEVLEVERPKRRRRSSRRILEKSDPSDAERAARAGNRPEKPRGAQERRRARGDDPSPAGGPPLRDEGEDLKAANQLQGLRVTAPEKLRHRLRNLSTKELVSVAARFRLGDDPRDVPTGRAHGNQVVRAPFGGSPLRGPL